MKVSLIVLAAGKQEGKTLDIKVPNFLIGRDPQCHLRPSSPMISKKHCALIVKDGKVYLKDYGSTNGSFVNDQPVKNAVQLKHGDKLKIGPLHFEVRLEVSAEAGQPVAAPAAGSQPADKPAAQAAKAGKTQPGGSTKPAAAEPKPSDADDDIAAMLLSGVGDDTVSDTPSAQDDIPQGTTVYDLPVPGSEPGREEHPAKDEKAKKEKPAKSTPSTPDTHSAAAAILDQMRKRPRS